MNTHCEHGGDVIESVRAVLLTPANRLLLIRRTWPGASPYWVFPGGHVEPEDPDLHAALTREVFEETGGYPQITGLIQVLADGHTREHFYLAHIESWSEAGRTGPEFDEPDRGEYALEEIPLTLEALGTIRLVPEKIAELLREAIASGTALAALAKPEH